MEQKQIRFLIADDNIDLCKTIEQNIKNTIRKFDVDSGRIVINKAFTEHAYDHGCSLVKGGFTPDICIFDLVFNGYSGIDLYEYITNHLGGHRPQLCIYTGVEKTYKTREESEVLASKSQGDVIIVPKPNIVIVMTWVEKVLEEKFLLTKHVEEHDPFDML